MSFAFAAGAIVAPVTSAKYGVSSHRRREGNARFDREHVRPLIGPAYSHS